MVHSSQIPPSSLHKYAASEKKPQSKGTGNGFCMQAFALKPQEKRLDVDLSCVRELDRDGEALCKHCRLPMGDFGYNGINGIGARVHGECLAQQMMKQLQEEEESRQKRDAEEKAARRGEYGIGWKVEKVPRNSQLQIKAKDSLPLQDMCCVVLEEGSRSVRLAPTASPSAAVNLQYLSIALQVRRQDGREPFFSLDPVEGKSSDDVDFDKHCVQTKRFEPEWLAGTSVGELMFQADYHLKELSMGECDQPVAGMKSCLDYSAEENTSKKWTAREWFMIRHAEIQMSEDNALIPVAKMGVEAREQVYSACGLVDAPITRNNHPMVKYAEAFTKNFDLIAERKSVVYHLRELAKASVLAKFLLDRNIAVPESWFNLKGDMEEASAMEVPQLWNERVRSKIEVADGEILSAATGINTHMHGVYGGVNMGMAQVPIAPRRVVAVTMPSRTGLLSGGSVERKYPTATIPFRDIEQIPRRPPGSGFTPSLSGALAPTPSLSGAFVPQLGASLSATGVAPPRGVDLCLNQFSLDSPPTAADGSHVKEAAAAMAKDFWACVDDGQQSDFGEEDVALFKTIFSAGLSDRRSEGDDFVPPDCSSLYVKKLRTLVKDEETLKQKRNDHFFSTDFSERNPGPLFPSSWASQFAMTNPKASVARESLQLRPDCTLQPELLKSKAPVFQKKTEDGTTFSIYRIGSVEMRTTQMLEGETTAGAVYSLRSSSNSPRGATAAGHDRVVKVSEYVENAQAVASAAHKYFSVVETERGSKIVTEFDRGKVLWDENVADLEDRISLAKVIRSASCSQTGATVQDLQNHREKILRQCSGHDKSRTYATGVYVVAMGGSQGVWNEVERRQNEWASCKP